MFEFELVVTEQCNLNCEYCYMNNRMNHMSLNVFNDHYNFLPEIMEMYNEERFNTCFFGGEPLLNWELIETVLPIINKNPKCTGFILPTNGILLNDYKINILKKYSVNISISYDGLWQEGSHDHFYRLKDMLDLKSCKVMISPKAIEKNSLVENYEYFLNFGILNPDFSLVRDDIWKPVDIYRFSKQIWELGSKVVENFEKGISSLPGIFSLYILDTMAGKKYGKRPFGCFAGCHGAAFMPNGKVYPCARFGSHDKHAIFTRVGDLDVYYKDMYFDVFKRETDIRKFSKCKKCELYQYCNAGCTFSQFDGGACKPVDSVCNLLKSCYEVSFFIVENLKDNKLFREMIKNMIGSMP